jgi:hypothetical protein
MWCGTVVVAVWGVVVARSCFGHSSAMRGPSVPIPVRDYLWARVMATDLAPIRRSKHMCYAIHECSHDQCSPDMQPCLSGRE